MKKITHTTAQKLGVSTKASLLSILSKTF